MLEKQKSINKFCYRGRNYAYCQGHACLMHVGGTHTLTSYIALSELVGASEALREGVKTMVYTV